MAEELEEQELERPDIRSFLGIVRRRHLQFLIPLFLGWFVVWGVSWFLPSRYKSSTFILVEQPTMPQSYVAPNINDDLQARLASMSEQILSRTRLLLIIQKLHLYDGAQLTDDQKLRLYARTSGLILSGIRKGRIFPHLQFLTRPQTLVWRSRLRLSSHSFSSARI